MKTTKKTPAPTVITRRAVKDLLNQSPAYSSLPPERKREIARDMAKVANYLTGPGQRGFPNLVKEVDFPDFVTDLINGVFGAIIDSSIKQMEAYAKLIAGVSKAVEEFADENLSDKQARDYLTERFPRYFQDDPKKRKPVLRLRKKIASQRQQLLATMVLMGINRIVVTKGTIRPR